MGYVSGNGLNGATYYVKALSLVNQSISSGTDGTIPDAEETIFSNGISVSSGVITFENAGMYRIQVQFNVDAQSTTTTIESWVEFDNEGVWEILENSGAIKEKTTFSEGVFFIESVFMLSAGASFRIKIRTESGTAVLDSATLSNGTVVPSTKVIAYNI